MDKYVIAAVTKDKKDHASFIEEEKKKAAK